MSCVYAHVFPNNKLYIGITKNDSPIRRWNNGKGYNTQKLVYRAIQKYGWDNIKHIILLENIDLNIAQEVEKFLIDKYKTQDTKFGYNISDGGRTNAGYHHTEEYKKQLSQSMRGRYVGEKSPCFGIPVPEEVKKKISETLTGRKPSLATRKKRSDSLKNHVVTEETRQKISNSHKLRCQKLSPEERRLSEEHKKHIGEALKGKSGYWKGKTQSNAPNIKRSNTLKGKHKSVETIEKLRLATLGKKKGPMTEEHKRKISEALKGNPKVGRPKRK